MQRTKALGQFLHTLYLRSSLQPGLTGIGGDICKCTSRRITTQVHRTRNVNTLIIGGGPIGSSAAFHLAKARGNDGDGIVVLERDPTYAGASAMFSAGGIRQQFSLKENIQMSLYGRDFLRHAGTLLRVNEQDVVDVQFEEHGYLFLASTEEGVSQMRENHNLQCELGCTDIKLLGPRELAIMFPWLSTDDLLLGSYGEQGEGWFDPWAFVKGLKDKNIEMGVEYVHGQPTSGKRDQGGRVVSVDVQHLSIRSRQVQQYNVDYIVNAAGAHAEQLMTLLAGPDRPLQHPLPVKPRKRCVFFFHCSSDPNTVPSIAPLTVDPSTLVYFRSEGRNGSGNFLCGVSPSSECDVDCHDQSDLENADFELFQQIIWPALYYRVPAFGEIKVRSSWAGLYEYNTIDQNAIIGFHPEMENVLMCNGFSGHGLQHSPAAGRACAELLDYGSFQTCNLGAFGFSRFLKDGVPVFEKGIV